MMLAMWLEKVKRALNLELCQIRHLACLATMAPNEVAREMVLNLIEDEVKEAMFWSNVLCAYSDMAMPVEPGAGYFPQPGVPCPGAPPVSPIFGPPGILPPAGPGATLPPSVPTGPVTGPGSFPGTFPGVSPGIPLAEQVKKEDKK